MLERVRGLVRSPDMEWVFPSAESFLRSSSRCLHTQQDRGLGNRRRTQRLCSLLGQGGRKIAAQYSETESESGPEVSQELAEARSLPRHECVRCTSDTGVPVDWSLLTSFQITALQGRATSIISGSPAVVAKPARRAIYRESCASALHRLALASRQRSD